MWLFVKAGFCSIVSHKDDRSLLVVRCRARVDAERFLGICTVETERLKFDPAYDYPFRFVVRREVMKRALSRVVDELDYMNFKEEVTKNRDAEAVVRGEAYISVWDELHRLEDLNDRHEQRS